MYRCSYILKRFRCVSGLFSNFLNSLELACLVLKLDVFSKTGPRLYSPQQQPPSPDNRNADRLIEWWWFIDFARGARGSLKIGINRINFLWHTWNNAKNISESMEGHTPLLQHQHHAHHALSECLLYEIHSRLKLWKFIVRARINCSFLFLIISFICFTFLVHLPQDVFSFKSKKND